MQAKQKEAFQTKYASDLGLEFAKLISGIVHEGEEEILEDSPRKKKASDKKYVMKPFKDDEVMKGLDLAKQYVKIEKTYKDPELVKVIKQYFEVDSRNALEIGWDKDELLKKELFDKLQALNQEALEKRKEGMGFLATRLWLRAERKSLKREMLGKIKVLEAGLLKEQEMIQRKFESKHPNFKEAVDSIYKDFYQKGLRAPLALLVTVSILNILKALLIL